jgi:hypothetical protein
MHTYQSYFSFFIPRALDVPTLDYTFEDCRVMNAAEDAGLPHHVGLIEAYNLCRKLGITIEDVLAQVRVFADYADKRSGLFRLDRFAQVLDLSLTTSEMVKLLSLAGVTVSRFCLRIVSTFYHGLWTRRSKNVSARYRNVLASMDRV